MREYQEVLNDLQHDGRRVTLYDLLFAATHHLYHPGPKPSVPEAQRHAVRTAARLEEVQSWTTDTMAAQTAHARFLAKQHGEHNRYRERCAPHIRRYTRLIKRVQTVRLPRNMPEELRQRVVDDLNKHLALMTPDAPLEPSLEVYIREQLVTATKQNQQAIRDLEVAKSRLKDWRKSMATYRRRVANLRRRRVAIGRTLA